MADEKLSKFEGVKEQSNFLRGTILEDLANGSEPTVSEDNGGLLKFHGSYQQDNRDARGGGHKEYSFMVRSRIPGGRVTADQFLAHLDMCEQFGNGALRITDRQGFQLHGVLKGDLRSAIRAINECRLTTIAACGDIVRNVMACPAPYKTNEAHRQLQEMADVLTMHFRPKSTAYFEIWLKDGENSELVHEERYDEPLYGSTYLPRKFKIGLTLPEDNCIDVYTQDLGMIAVVENGSIVGYNFVIGGGMGVTPAKKDTFPAVAKRICYVPVDQVTAVAEAVVKIHRDFGDRTERKRARLKYVVHDWGIPKFKAKLEEYYGAALADPHATEVTGIDDHIGWHEQGDGKLFLGINVENGRLRDDGSLNLKAFFRELLTRFPLPTRLTALQSVILCDVDPKDKAEIEAIMLRHSVKRAEDWTVTRRYSIACPALPTCGLAVTESERILPSVMDELDVAMEQIGLKDERITLHMTGCPNGCARPYIPEIGLVGKARGKYTVFLGGSPKGNRLNFLFKDMVAQEAIVPLLTPILIQFRDNRLPGETFGDFCVRLGKDALATEEVAAAT